jgi:16S rRNA (adenine1518-N6/adenine1519-N6)-dimethyltransferase
MKETAELMESIPDLFNEFSFRPRKSAGQNFLADPKILDRIEEVVQCPSGDSLLEVGGGYGALTERLSRKGNPLTVVEPDHKLFAMLERKFKGQGNVTLVKADILALELAPFQPPPPGKLTVVGNIPYYLTTPLIIRLLTRYRPLIRRIYFMVQKEVADRMAALPGTKAYGSLTLCVQYHAKVENLIKVPAGCFKPRPKVDSAFVGLELRENPILPQAEEAAFFTLVRAVFQSRRKVLSNSLKLLGKPLAQTQGALAKVKLDPQVRGEQLDMGTLMELAKAVSALEIPRAENSNLGE